MNLEEKLFELEKLRVLLINNKPEDKGLYNRIVSEEARIYAKQTLKRDFLLKKIEKTTDYRIISTMSNNEINKNFLRVNNSFEEVYGITYDYLRDFARIMSELETSEFKFIMKDVNNLEGKLKEINIDKLNLKSEFVLPKTFNIELDATSFSLYDKYNEIYNEIEEEYNANKKNLLGEIYSSRQKKKRLLKLKDLINYSDTSIIEDTKKALDKKDKVLKKI